jgi:hypothetical protein
MPRTLEIAIQQAVTKRGVSVVVMPGNDNRSDQRPKGAGPACI